MKTLITIILTLAILGCSTEPEIEPEAKIIGTWEIIDDRSAEWIGASTQSKTNSETQADTLYIEKAGDYGLSMIQINDNKGHVSLSMYDSTFVLDETMDVYNLDLEVSFPNGQSEKINMSWNSKSFGVEGAATRLTVNYMCDHQDVVQDEMIQYSISESGNLLRVYRFLTVGFSDTIEEISC